jgi:rubrerythrin
VGSYHVVSGITKHTCQRGNVDVETSIVMAAFDETSPPSKMNDLRDRQAAAARLDARTVEYICLICGAAMWSAHCKVKCPNCGFTRDCSDG